MLARLVGPSGDLVSLIAHPASTATARAAVALAYFKAIYRIEAACNDEALSPEARLARIRPSTGIPGHGCRRGAAG